MQRFILLLILCFSIILARAVTVTVNDYGYADGKIRNFMEGSWNSSTTDLSEGTGKSWTFTMPSPGYVNNTYHNVSNDANFPAANLRSTYSQYVNGGSDSGNLYYQLSGGDIFSIGYTGFPNLLWNPPIPTGLPHYLNKTWQGTYAYTWGSYTIVGKVISEGTLTTPLGTFAAVCVRYAYSSQAISYTCYQWETCEYGIMAYSLTLNGGMLYVLYQADQNTASSDEFASAVSKLSCYPNPVSESFSVSFKQDTADQVELSLYNIKGQLIRTLQKTTLPVGKQELTFTANDSQGKSLVPGIYFLRLNSGKQSSVCKIIKL